MTIELKNRFGFELIVEAENVRIVEDIEIREYAKDENGKIIADIRPNRDISTYAISQFADILQEMIYHRKSEFDSSDLIESLFQKLPFDTAVKLAEKLKNQCYIDNEDEENGIL
jgi:hypothetical protein